MADAKAMGFELPTGQDYMSKGDDAISKNAQKAADLIAELQEKNLTRILTEADKLDTLTQPGDYSIYTQAVAEAVGSPIWPAAVEVTALGNSTIQTITGNGSDPRVFERATLSGGAGWGDMRRTDTPTRLALHQLTLAGAGNFTDSEPSRHVRLPMKFPVRVDRWRLTFRNTNDRDGVNFGDVNMVHVWIAKRKFDANGNGTADYAEAPVDLGQPVALGSGSSRRWVIETLFPLDAEVDYIIGYAYTAPSGQANHLAYGGGYLGTLPIGVSSMEVSNAWSPTIPLDVYVMATVPDATPTFAYIGSSSEVGANTNYPVRDSWVWRHAWANGAIASQLAHSGSTAERWAENGFRWTKPAAASRVDRVYEAAGSNDLYAGFTLAAIKASKNMLAQQVRKYIGDNIFYPNIFARDPEPAAVKANRLALNEWLATLPNDARSYYDRAAPITSPTGLLAPAYDSGDGTHLNALGHAKVAQAVDNGTTRPYTVDQSVGRVVRIWDYLNQREQMIYGETGERNIASLVKADAATVGAVTVLRSGNRVEISLYDLVSKGSGASLVLGSLPSGFRPPGTRSWTLPAAIQGTAPVRSAVFSASGNLSIYNTALGDTFRTVLAFNTNEPWPTSLPGVAV